MYSLSKTLGGFTATTQAASNRRCRSGHHENHRPRGRDLRVEPLEERALLSMGGLGATLKAPLDVTTDSLAVSAGSSVTSGGLPNLTPYQPNGWGDKLVVANNGSSTTNTTLYDYRHALHRVGGNQQRLGGARPTTSTRESTWTDRWIDVFETDALAAGYY